MLANRLSRPRWAMPMTASGAGPGRLVEHGVEHHARRLGALQAKALLPDVAGVQEALEDLGGVQPVEQVSLLGLVEVGRHALHVLLDPALLGRVLDVHVLDAEGPAVGLAEQLEDLVEGGRLQPGQAVGQEGPGQVPDGEAVGGRVELGVEVDRLDVEGVEVGHQVPAHAVHVDERLHVHLLGQALAFHLGRVVGRLGVAVPAGRLVGDAHGREHVVVEAVPTFEALGHVRQEEARLGALDDPVVAPDASNTPARGAMA